MESVCLFIIVGANSFVTVCRPGRKSSRGQIAMNALGVFVTFNYVALGWFFFTLSTPAIVWQAILKLFGINLMKNSHPWRLLIKALIIFVILNLAYAEFSPPVGRLFHLQLVGAGSFKIPRRKKYFLCCYDFRRGFVIRIPCYFGFTERFLMNIVCLCWVTLKLGV